MSPTADSRLEALRLWLRGLPASLGLQTDTLRPASSDASFRRYFRLDAGAGSVIVMDAPPPHEDTRPFLHVAGLLRDAGLNVPAILAEDQPRGFLLLSDLGPHTYYQRIQDGLDDATLQTLYRQALAALVRMQQASVSGLAAYDSARLMAELELFPEWYVARHHGLALDADAREALQGVFHLLSTANGSQPTVLVHRDFHSPNLMACQESRHGPNPGIIDFQDALAGPITYDLASLVTDARTTWEEAQQLDWAIRYWEMARAAGLPVAADFADFHRAYEWMGLQRNLRILGVFARLHHRDGKPGYLAHIPRVNTYVRQVASRYGAFAPLLRLLDRLDDSQPTVGYTF
ncbi:aminoglycoside phosphotransferase [Bordetella genomosp. 8]|uniref:Aminoglycoside phosphotransferase n=1 Tax=Bordetella genomosp. 8 TaxID=1416806 RepID=A0A1W6YHG4_9BORD|nr:phosphotransferase [Bordetella genomosp. 8]ARP80481.1 aminoglycoside phosphotransferase [Bordetella genomosp. 8]